MRIAVDAGGSDFPLAGLISGAAGAALELGAEISFIGPRQALDDALRAAGLEGRASGGRPPSIEVVDASSAIGPLEDPQTACREKPDASVMRAAGLVGARKADALVATGGIGAAIAAALWHMKRLRGVLRPALACLVPTRSGSALIIDAGGNLDCKPWHLLQFALMGSIYAERVLKIAKPKVGLLAPAAAGLGNGELARESVPLIRYAGIDFLGTMRGDEIPSGAADVVVCDGCAGDIALRLCEGLSSVCFEMLKSQLESRTFAKLGRALMGPALVESERRMGCSVMGAGPILGLEGPAVLCRKPGSAESAAQAVRIAAALAGSDLNDRIRERLEDIKSDMELARGIE